MTEMFFARPQCSSNIAEILPEMCPSRSVTFRMSHYGLHFIVCMVLLLTWLTDMAVMAVLCYYREMF